MGDLMAAPVWRKSKAALDAGLKDSDAVTYMIAEVPKVRKVKKILAKEYDPSCFTEMSASTSGDGAPQYTSVSMGCFGRVVPPALL